MHCPLPSGLARLSGPGGGADDAGHIASGLSPLSPSSLSCAGRARKQPPGMAMSAVHCKKKKEKKETNTKSASFWESAVFKKLSCEIESLREL